MISRAMNLIVRAIQVASVATCLLCVCASSGQPGYAQTAGISTPAAPGTPALATPTLVGQALTPSAAGSPTSATSAAEAACKQALANLTSGDLSALKSLPPELQSALLRDEGAAAVFTCLAIADGKTSYCNALPNPAKDQCLDHAQLISELKGLPKKALKPQIMYHLCAHEASKADCEKVRQAMTSGDAALCNAISTPTGAWGSHFCAVLATGDAAQCASAPDASIRAECTALVSDDPSHCPKTSIDCSKMAQRFALIKKYGFNPPADDPTVGYAGETGPLAAARDGKPGCARLVTQLEHFCVAAPAASTPVPSP